jgi:hypothetical protein
MQGIHLLVQLIDVKAGYQSLGEFADMLGAARQVLPFVGLEERELGCHVDGNVGTAKVEVRDHSCKRIYVGRKHVRLARERIAEAAFARLDLTY